MKNQVECPKCFGAKEIMEPKKDKGFEYNVCSLCKGEGVVSEELADDFEFSINEENFKDNEDF
jgi:DnaJ-class molecular chaperone